MVKIDWWTEVERLSVMLEKITHLEEEMVFTTDLVLNGLKELCVKYWPSK